MIPSDRAMVIIGSGMAGGNAAKTLRGEGYDGPLIMIGHEPGVPFGRPPLSKTYLRGEEDLSGWLVEPPDWYQSQNVELLRATATRIDPVERRVELSTGATIAYQKLLIATGGENRRPNMPGSNLPGVIQLRTLASCDAIKRSAKRGSRALIVGMGFIGCEVAASLRQLGVAVTAVVRGDYPLENVLGSEMGRLMAEVHRDAGVELITHDEVTSFEGDGRVERAVTRQGRRVECELAIVAIGIQPTVGVLRDLNLPLDDGVAVDERCQTPNPDIFAAGDVANHQHPLFGRVRVEHYNNSEKQGAAAARSMLGSRAPYDYLHSFWSDQYDHKLEYAGHAREWDDFVVRGSMKERKLVGFYLKAGTLLAAVGFDRGGDPELEKDSEMANAARLVANRARPDAAALADPDVDLATL